MKAGDRLYCYKMSLNLSGKFQVGVWYYVKVIYKTSVYISLGDGKENGFWFSSLTNVSESLYRYFYTEKEMRKIKLDKICLCQE